MYVSVVDVALRGELMKDTKFRVRLKFHLILRWVVAIDVTVCFLEEMVVWYC